MTGERGFLKRHGFLIAGVALPVLVVVGFVLARTLPRLWVADPLHDVLYVVRSAYGSHPGTVDGALQVVDGRLRVHWSKLTNQAYAQTFHVFRLHPPTGAVVEVGVPEPEHPDALEGAIDLQVGGLEGFRIDTSPRAPDGYEFDCGSGGSTGLMNEVFIHRYRGPRCVIRKSGRVMVLPRTDGDSYGYPPVQFLGWLVPVGGDR